MHEDRIFLLPGEFHVARRPCQISTLLGSCVSVVLRHKTKPYGAMNHFLLPDGRVEGEEKGRYGTHATETILWLIGKLDPNLRAYEVSLYGGAAVVGHLGASGMIGEKNIETAREILARHNLRPIHEDVGGTLGRRICFDIGAGTIVCNPIRKTQASEEVERKRADLAGRPTRILIVDDSELVRNVLRRAIEESEGLEVCGEAADAYEARDLIVSTNPDVISLDIIMPKMDGLKFLQKISQYFPKPVVICSTIAQEHSDVVEKAYAYGAVDVVDKNTLDLYMGMEVVKKAFIPKLRRAAGKVVRARLFENP